MEKEKHWQEIFRSTVVRRFEQLKEDEPTLSMRSLAKRAHISSGAMSQILKNTLDWNLTPSRALSVLHDLGVDQEQRNYIAALTDQGMQVRRAELPRKDYDILNDWTYIPILTAFDLSARPPPETLAAKLNISVEKVNHVIADLLERGYLKRTANGQIYRDRQHWETSDGPPNEAVRRHHEENLKVAQMALDSVKAEDRYFLSMTFAGNPAQLDYIRAEIKKLFDKASSLLEQHPPQEELYKLSVSLFPLDFPQKKEPVEP